MEQHLCNYIVILDNDSAAKTKVNESIDKLNIEKEKFRYFFIPNYRECELEDMYTLNYYKDYMLNTYQINILDNHFKNKSQKWSKRITELARQTGQEFSEDQINEIKKELSEMSKTKPLIDVFTPESITLIKNILNSIEKDISKMFT